VKISLPLFVAGILVGYLLDQPPIQAALKQTIDSTVNYIKTQIPKQDNPDVATEETE